MAQYYQYEQHFQQQPPQPPQQLQWKGPAAPRAKPIPPQKWEEHRAELCTLYQMRSLDDVMSTMKVLHPDFSPTRRQYVSQFEKWGIHKYNAAIKTTPSSPPGSLGSNQQPHKNSQENAALEITSPFSDRPAKRPQKATIGEKPKIPPKLRKVTDYMTSRQQVSSSTPNTSQTSLLLQCTQMDIDFSGGSTRQATYLVTEKTTRRPVHQNLEAESFENPPNSQDTRLEKPELFQSPMDLDPYENLAMAFEKPKPLSEMKHHDSSPSFSEETRTLESHRKDQQKFNAVPSSSQPHSGTPCIATTPRPVSISMSIGATCSVIERPDDNATNTSLATCNFPGEESSTKSLVPFRPDASSTSISESVTVRTRRDVDRPIRSSSKKNEFDSSRPIDAYTSDEIHQMKRAADFLFSLGLGEDAFPLYVLIFKRLRDSKKPAWMISSSMISCARSAVLPSQVVIARNLLENKYEEYQKVDENDKKLVLRLVTGYACDRTCNAAFGKFHTDLAARSSLDDDRLGIYVPEEGDSLDTRIYFHLARSLGYCDTPPKLKARMSARALGKRNARLVEDNQDSGESAETASLVSVFKGKEGSMKNPCLRSCVQWCNDELARLSSLPEEWEDVLLGIEGGVLGFAEKMAIFRTLWELSDCFKPPSASPQRPMLCMWVTHAEKLMGISATELLKTCCYMILAALPNGEAHDEKNLISRARAGAELLSQATDEELGCRFLDVFSWINNPFTYSPQLEELKHIIRYYGREYLEDTLKVTLPPLQQEKVEDEYEEASEYATETDTPRRRSFQIFSARISDTLAPSIRSSDLASMLSLRDRIDFEAVFNGPSRNSSRTNVTIMSMAELSEAMASNLSLASTSARKSMENAANNVRSRITEIEGSCSIAIGELTRRG